jgi:hypothetical protein
MNAGIFKWTQEGHKKYLMENEICQLLVNNGQELTAAQRYFIADALDWIMAGCFDRARSALKDAQSQELKVSPYALRRISDTAPSTEALISRLSYIKGMPARGQPVFRWQTIPISS